MKKLKLVLLAAALATTSMAWAQDGKAALVKQFLDMQKPAIEGLARTIVERPSTGIVQAASSYLQTQVPPEKRESTAKAAEAELRKYLDETYPIVRDKALQLAPSTIGPVLEQNFSEDELRQLITFFSSPTIKKYQEVNPQLLNALMSKLATDVGGTIESKVRTLDTNMAKALGAPVDGALPQQAPSKKKK